MSQLTKPQKTILLVEDEIVTATYEKNQLEKYGYNVIHVETGEDAITGVSEYEEVDLVLMDIDLGTGMDGTEAAQQILLNKAIPLVFLSSHIEPEIVDKTDTITSYGYIEKTSSMTVIHASIKMAFRLYEANEKVRQYGEIQAKLNDKLRETVEVLEHTNKDLVSTKEHLDDREQQYSDLMKYMKSGVIVYSVVDDGVDFIILDINSAVEEIEHISREEVIGKSITEIFPGMKDFGLLEVLTRVWKTGISEIHSDAWYSDERISGWRTSYVYRLSSGTMVTIYEDITEEKRLREEFENLFYTINDAIVKADSQGVIILANDMAARFSGYDSKEELIGMEMEELYADSSHREKLLHDLKENNGFLMNYEFQLKKKDNTILWALCNIRYTRDNNGNITGTLGALRDISDIKETMEAIRRREHYLSAILAASHDSFWMVDRSGCFENVNSATEEMYGYSRSELIGLHMHHLEAQDRPNKMEERMNGIVENGYEIFQSVHRRKDGSLFDAEIFAAFMDIDQGKVICLCRDITKMTE